MATLMKYRARKPVIDVGEVVLSGNFPVSGDRKTSMDISVNDGNPTEGKLQDRYTLKLSHVEMVRATVFGAQLATSPNTFDNGYYSPDRRPSWQCLRDLADKLEAEAKAVAASARPFSNGGPWNGTDGQAY